MTVGHSFLHYEFLKPRISKTARYLTYNTFNIYVAFLASSMAFSAAKSCSLVGPQKLSLLRILEDSIDNKSVHKDT